jgi:hypothetical protein
MASRDRSRSLTDSGVLYLLGLLLASPTLAAASGDLLVSGTSGRSDVRWILAKTRSLADEKLSQASCVQVFSEFRDADGRTLSENLERLGVTGKEYFDRWLVFYDGSGRPSCSEGGRVAFTTPGSRAIFLCSPQLIETAHRDPGWIAALLIHEELHSLGLGENPPSSREITAQVIARCGK